MAGRTRDISTGVDHAAIAVHWLGDGDHDLKPRKASGRSHQKNLAEAIAAVAAFAARLSV